MPGTWLGLLVAALVAAGPRAVEGRPSDSAEDKTLVAHSSVQWLKVYSLPIYRERWRLEGRVKDLEADLPRVRQVFAKVGAALEGPPGDGLGGKSRRLIYRCPQKSARLALVELAKLGSFSAPRVQSSQEPVSLAEVQGKISSLEADKAGHAAELARMPAVAELVEELLGHLRGVASDLRRPEVDVLVELTVKGER